MADQKVYPSSPYQHTIAVLQEAGIEVERVLINGCDANGYRRLVLKQDKELPEWPEIEARMKFTERGPGYTNEKWPNVEVAAAVQMALGLDAVEAIANGELDA